MNGQTAHCGRAKIGRRKMAAVVVTTFVNAPRERVFAAVTDPRKPFLTSNSITRMETASEQTAGVGTIYRWTFALPFGLHFKFDEVVTEWIEPERLAYRAVSGWEMEALAVFTPEDGGTRETFTLCFRAPGLWNWLIPKWLVRLGIRRALANIQKRVTKGMRP